MAKHIHIYLPARKVTDRKAKDAGVFAPIKEIEEQIEKYRGMVSKAKRDGRPYAQYEAQFKEAQAELDKAKKRMSKDSQKPYVSSTRAGYEVLGNKGQVVKTFPKPPAGKEAALSYLKTNYNEMVKDAGEALATAKRQLVEALRKEEEADQKIEAQENSGIANAETRGAQQKAAAEVVRLQKLIKTLGGSADTKAKDAVFTVSWVSNLGKKKTATHATEQQAEAHVRQLKNSNLATKVELTKDAAPNLTPEVKQSRINRLARQFGIPAKVAEQELIAEEWDEERAAENLRHMSKNIRAKATGGK